jgi:hypothetical protein
MPQKKPLKPMRTPVSKRIWVSVYKPIYKQPVHKPKIKKSFIIAPGIVNSALMEGVIGRDLLGTQALQAPRPRISQSTSAFID